MTNSQTKFVLVLDEASPRDELLAKAFKAMHNLFVESTSNPFYTCGTPLTSPAFARDMAAIVGGYAQQLAAGGS